MKICILTPRFPFPENGGDVLRINNIARYLKSKGHFLILITFCQKKEIVCENLYDKIITVKRNSFISLLNSFFAFISGKPIQVGYYYSLNLLKKFKKVVKDEKPDIYISHLLRMVPYLKQLRLQSESIIEMTDALSKTYELSTKTTGLSLKKVIYFFEKKLISKYEKQVIHDFRKVVLVSESDKKFLGYPTNVFVHQNGVNCLNSISSKYDKYKITFIGNMRTLQNQDAVLYFIKSVFPIIKKSIPNAYLKIVGAQPSESIKTLADGKNIIVTGYVDSVEEELKDACLNVAPVRIAAGIQNKVLIAMACNVPVVLTSLISQAIPELKSGINCEIADDPIIFAEKIIRLMTDDKYRNDIAYSGYEIVKKNYSWFQRLDGYEKI